MKVLAALPVVETVATGFRVAPFLGRLNAPPPAWRRQETEIDEILEVPLEDLTHPEAHAVEHWQLPGWAEPREIPFYRIGPYKLWGATYKIVDSIRDYLEPTKSESLRVPVEWRSVPDRSPVNPQMLMFCSGMHGTMYAFGNLMAGDSDNPSSQQAVGRGTNGRPSTAPLRVGRDPLGLIDVQRPSNKGRDAQRTPDAAAAVVDQLRRHSDPQLPAGAVLPARDAQPSASTCRTRSSSSR